MVGPSSRKDTSAQLKSGNMGLFIVCAPTLLPLLLLLLLSSSSASAHLAFSPVMRGFPQQRHRVSMAVNPEDVEGYQKDTKAVKAGYKGSGWSSDPLGRSVVNPPTFHVSTVTYPNVSSLREAAKDYPFRGLSYGRHGTPTTWALEEAFAAVEGGVKSVCVASGVAAINTAILAFVQAGDHVLISDGVYDPTRSFCDKFLARFGVQVDYFDPLISAKDLEEKFLPNSKLLFLESPTSLSFELHDFPALAKVGKDRGAVVVCDNTWGPGIFNALHLGADVSLNAATKYIGGHSDLMMGLIAVKTEEMYRSIKLSAVALGCPAGPDDAYLALRGIRTLSVRMKRHEESGLLIARWLERRSEVKRVMHPALQAHPQHDLWKRDFTGSCGLFGFQLSDDFDQEAVDVFLNTAISDGMWGMGYSWGGFESLVLQTDINSCRSVRAWDYGGGLGKTIRAHAGLEDPKDLTDGLVRAFDAMAQSQSERSPKP